MARCPACGKHQLGPVVDNHVCNPPDMEECFWCKGKGYVETAGDHRGGVDCPHCKDD